MSTTYEATGTVHAIPKARREKYATIVVKTEDGKYPQVVPFDCKADLAATVGVGDEVKVTFNLRGREWTNPQTGEVKFFGENSAFKVEITKRAAGTTAVPGGYPPPDDGDIPF